MFFLLALWSCEKPPTAADRTGMLTLHVQDASNFTTLLYGTRAVAGAEAKLRSINYGVEYTAYTDSLGSVTMTGLISDVYNVSIVRSLTPDEVQKVTGVAKPRRLTAARNLYAIRPDLSQNQGGQRLDVDLDLPVMSDIVISEMYTCGAPGAGLYWYDKYVELCNIGDTVAYLDGLVIAEVYKGFITDPFIHSTEVWKMPGTGRDYAIRPGQFVVLATDAIDHRVNAPNSVDLSRADFEFYLWTGPDLDNPAVPNVLLVYQPNGFDWLMGGEDDAFVIARVLNTDSLQYANEKMLIPKSAVIDGVEYLKDQTRMDKKKLDPMIDGGAAPGCQFYTGYSMERKARLTAKGWTLEDNDNSTLDFEKITHPTPGYHHTIQRSN